MKLRQLQASNDEVYGISRKLFIALANDQLRRRKRFFGSKANVCKGCLDILLCDGPISFEICETIEELMDCNLLSGPQKMPWERRRRKAFPALKRCLEVYGIAKKGGWE